MKSRTQILLFREKENKMNISIIGKSKSTDNYLLQIIARDTPEKAKADATAIIRRLNAERPERYDGIRINWEETDFFYGKIDTETVYEMFR